MLNWYTDRIHICISIIMQNTLINIFRVIYYHIRIGVFMITIYVVLPTLWKKLLENYLKYSKLFEINFKIQRFDIMQTLHT